MSIQPDLLWDTRLLPLRLRGGEITQEQLSSRLQSLPDVSEKASVFEVSEAQPVDVAISSLEIDEASLEEEQAESYEASELS